MLAGLFLASKLCLFFVYVCLIAELPVPESIHCCDSGGPNHCPSFVPLRINSFAQCNETAEFQCNP